MKPGGPNSWLFAHNSGHNQILFFKELGFPLKRIKYVLGRGGMDRVAALNAHRSALTRELERLKGLIQTIDKTVKHIKRESEMEHKDFYEGFSPEKQAEYEKYLIDRFGDTARENIAESKRRTKDWKGPDVARFKEKLEDLNRRFAKALESGHAAESTEVQELVAEHHAWIDQFWTPTKSSYADLGQLYAEHEDFRKYYEAYHRQLADFLAEAMKFYAERNLA